MLKDNIKYYRRLANLTLEDIAKKIGVSRQTIQRYESGVIGNIPSNNVEKIAEALGVTPAHLMGWIDDKPLVFPAANYPMLEECISAGIPESIEAIKQLPEITIPNAVLGKYAHNKNILIMRINGESMNKIIPNGSAVAVLTTHGEWIPQNGDIVVFSYNGEYAVKQFFETDSEIIMRPMSTELTFSDLVINKERASELRIIGKIVMYTVVL